MSLAASPMDVPMGLLDRLNAIAGGEITDLTRDAFDPFVSRPRLVFVDFWAGWCRPCRAMAPVIRRLARDFSRDVAFAKVDTEVEKDLAREFAIKAIPTYVLFKKGRIVERFSGATSRDRLARKIEKWL